VKEEMMMFKEKQVQMTAGDWMAAGDEARAAAVSWLRQEDPMVLRSNALVRAAELLRAADAFYGRFNVLAYVEEGVDVGTIEVEESAQP
jgi:hypothetical protein